MYEETCKFVLNETSHCICKNAHHNLFDFGVRGVNRDKYDKNYIYFDDVNYVCKYIHDDDFELSESHFNLFKSGDITINTNEVYSKAGKYFLNCDCNYCTYSKNKYLNIYNECFCCKKHLYIKNNMYNITDFLHCYNCNYVLCDNCFVQGRYTDEEELYCFECRRFTIHKNQYFYFGDNIIPDDDWMNASWYY